MSVIHYEDEKFQDIFAAGCVRPEVAGHLFGYPEEWKIIGNMDPVLKTWVGQLHLANCAAHNARYDGIHASTQRIEMDGERDLTCGLILN